MKQLKIVFSGLFLMAVALNFTACIGGGGGGITASSAAQVTTSFASALNTLPKSTTAVSIPAFAGGITTAAYTKGDSKNIALKNKKPTRSIAAGNLNSCVTFAPNPVVDADGDGIAADKTYTFDCSSAVDGGNTYNWKGTFKVADKNDNSGPSGQGTKGGYKYEFNMPTYNFKDASGNVSGYSHMGFWDVTGTDTTTNYTSDYTSGVNGTYVNVPNLGTVNYDYKFTSKFVGAVTHDVSWTNGTMKYDGSFNWDGTFLEEDQNGKHQLKTGNANMKVQSDGLVFNAACTKYFQSGSWILTDSNGGVLKVTYSCTTVKTYFNGKEITTGL